MIGCWVGSANHQQTCGHPVSFLVAAGLDVLIAWPETYRPCPLVCIQIGLSVGFWSADDGFVLFKAPGILGIWKTFKNFEWIIRPNASLQNKSMIVSQVSSMLCCWCMFMVHTYWSVFTVHKYWQLCCSGLIWKSSSQTWFQSSAEEKSQPGCSILYVVFHYIGTTHTRYSTKKKIYNVPGEVHTLLHNLCICAGLVPFVTRLMCLNFWISSCISAKR